MKSSDLKVQVVESPDMPHSQLWRQQCARNLMDCYALGMELQSLGWESGRRSEPVFEALTRQVVEGIMAEWEKRPGERTFYRRTADLCRACVAACETMDGAGRSKAGLFRIYAAIFEEMGLEGA